MMDFGWTIGFDRPWLLLLLLVLPPMIYLSLTSLAGLGPWRKLFAIALRCFCIGLIVFSLAQMKWQRKTDRLTVLYLLDQSASITPSNRKLMLDYAFRQVKQHRRKKQEDNAGVIVFGTNARIESAPFDGDLPLTNRLESVDRLNNGGTSIESALKIAQAAFPEGTAGRVVIVSDGNENVGDALAVARAMAEDGIGIDVVPVELLARQDVSVDKVDVPADIRKGQSFPIRVVLTNKSEPTDDNPEGTITGQLSVTNNVVSMNSKDGLLSQKVTLKPGKNIFSFDHKLERSAMYTLTAEFEPEVSTADMISENNQASSFTHVRGKGKVLLIEDAFYRSEFDHLVSQLTKNEIEVEVRDTDQLFESSADLLQYDSVILANVAKATGDDTAQGDVKSFSDAQIRMLVDNCEHFGCGIVMLGGDRAFGAGGWSNTLLEKAMPVDFQIKNNKINAVGALAMMMHACEMPQGNHWQIKVAEEAIKVLGPMDHCGIVDWADFNGKPKWLWRFDKRHGGIDRVFGNRRKMLGLVNRMNTGDMMDFNTPMKTMLVGLDKVDAAMKHVIIISDGDPTPPTNKLLREFIKRKIKISTCAIGTHGPAGSTPLKKIANTTGGKYYVVNKASALPQIYQYEARRVAKPVIYESKTGISAVPVSSMANHEILKGIDLTTMPPFLGYVMTTIKSSGLVERLAMTSRPDKPGTEDNRTLLATWRYGNGRTVCFTSDAGLRWTNSWVDDSRYDQLFTQMIRYSMRPVTKDANFSVATDYKDGKARITITALDEKEEFLNFLDMYGSGIGGTESTDLQFSQVGPGRYVAVQDIAKQGDWLFTIFPGKGYQRLMTGVSVPYSKEYSDRQSNLALLKSMARLEPTGGEVGTLSPVSLNSSAMNELQEMNTFRPTLSSSISIQDIWPWLVLLCGTVFLADVFVRRVAITFDWVGVLWRKLITKFTGGDVEEKPSSMSRLQSRKAEIEKEIETRRSNVRFAPDEPVDDASGKSGKQQLEDVIASEIDKTPTPLPKPADNKLAAEDESTYTSRLLEAKRKARQKQDRRDDST